METGIACGPKLKLYPEMHYTKWRWLNDYFHSRIDPECLINDYCFIILNRWGQEVFKTTDPSARWDGKYLGIPAEMGAYMYYLKFKSGVNNTEQSLKGDVTLVR